MKTVEATVDGPSLELTAKTQRLDASTAREFKNECAEVWQPGLSRVTADLSLVEFIDSSGVGALLSLYKKLDPQNPSVRLRHVQPAVRTVIELLRLHRIFELES